MPKPKKYVCKSKGPYAKHKYPDMEKSVKAVQEGTLSVRAAAEKFGIAKSTLGDRVSGKTDIYARSGRKSVLPHEIEHTIVETVTQSAEKGFGLSRRQLLTKISILCKKAKITGFKNVTTSKHVWDGLRHRHPELSLRKPELNPTVVDNYLRDLENIVTELNLKNRPNLIWNCDETGKNLEHPPTHVVARKGSKNVVVRTGNDRTNITIMACVNAVGDKMPVARGKTLKSLYGYNCAEAPPNTVWTYKERAWMNEEVGEHWFRSVFLKNCGPDHHSYFSLMDMVHMNL